MPDTYQPQRVNRDFSLAGQIREIADRAAESRPDYRRIQLDLWCLCILARKEADTLDAQMIDMACNLKEPA